MFYQLNTQAIFAISKIVFFVFFFEDCWTISINVQFKQRKQFKKKNKVFVLDFIVS